MKWRHFSLGMYHWDVYRDWHGYFRAFRRCWMYIACFVFTSLTIFLGSLCQVSRNCGAVWESPIFYNNVNIRHSHGFLMFSFLCLIFFLFFCVFFFSFLLISFFVIFLKKLIHISSTNSHQSLVLVESFAYRMITKKTIWFIENIYKNPKMLQVDAFIGHYRYLLQPLFWYCCKLIGRQW